MERLDSELAPLVVGDDYDVARTVVGLAADDSVQEAWLTIRESEFSPAFVVQKHITGAAGTEGQVTSDSSGQELLFQLLIVDTEKLDPYTEYRYDIEVLTENGKRMTRERGRLVPKSQVTTHP